MATMKYVCLSCLMLYGFIVAASNTSDSSTCDVLCIDKDIIGLLERMAVVETKVDVYTEDRAQLFEYFKVTTKMMGRLIQIEKENDMLKTSLETVKNEKDLLNSSLETVKNENIEVINIMREMQIKMENFEQRLQNISHGILSEDIHGMNTEPSKSGANIANLGDSGTHDNVNEIGHTNTKYSELSTHILDLNQTVRLLQTEWRGMKLHYGQNGRRTQTAFCAKMTRKRFIDKRIVYNAVVLNEGSSYNSSTGIFTSKYDGLFVFSWVTEVYNNQKKNSYLTVNGEKKLVVYSYAQPGRYNDATGVGVVRLRMGDQVYITVNSIVGVDTHQTNFCGWNL